MGASGSVVERVVKWARRFYERFEEFADYGFRYIDAPWFSDYQKPGSSLQTKQLENKQLTA